MWKNTNKPKHGSEIFLSQVTTEATDPVETHEESW